MNLNVSEKLISMDLNDKNLTSGTYFNLNVIEFSFLSYRVLLILFTVVDQPSATMSNVGKSS